MNSALSLATGSKGENKNRSIWMWAGILLLVNLPLFWGEIRTSLIYLPEAVAIGQWWRTITYPLVHLSYYHLLLDAGGFLLLYGCLEDKRHIAKYLYIICSSAGSLLLVLAIDPSVEQRGLAGLSGIAHGLMAIAALEMLRHKNQRAWGWISLFLVVGKSAYELWTGQVVFEFLHMGMCGDPLAASHAGGVIGAIVAFFLIRACTTSDLNSLNVQGPSTVDGATRFGVQNGLILLIKTITRFMYRVRYLGLENIPRKGPAVLVCNHVTYIDWLIIASACRRPVHFVMHASIYRMPVLNWIFRLANVIPIESGRKNPAALRRAFDDIACVLQGGGLVCIFPEGHLTRDGRIDHFRPGIERIIQRQPAPVVPLALRGLWGSFFSHKNGPAMRSLPEKLWAPIELAVGKKIEPWQVTAPGLRCSVKNLLGGTA